MVTEVIWKRPAYKTNRAATMRVEQSNKITVNFTWKKNVLDVVIVEKRITKTKPQALAPLFIERSNEVKICNNYACVESARGNMEPSSFENAKHNSASTARKNTFSELLLQTSNNQTKACLKTSKLQCNKHRFHS